MTAPPISNFPNIHTHTHTHTPSLFLIFLDPSSSLQPGAQPLMPSPALTLQVLRHCGVLVFFCFFFSSRVIDPAKLALKWQHQIKTFKTHKESYSLSRVRFCDPMDCNSLFLYPWNSPGKNTRMGGHALLQRSAPSQGSNLGLSHCRQILYCLKRASHASFLKELLKEELQKSKTRCLS